MTMTRNNLPFTTLRLAAIAFVMGVVSANVIVESSSSSQTSSSLFQNLLQTPSSPGSRRRSHLPAPLTSTTADDDDGVSRLLRRQQQQQQQRETAVAGRVEYDLFFAIPGDALTKDFFLHFKNIAVNLGSRAYFTPRPYILDGASFGCIDDVESGKDCNSLCTNHGRYCGTIEHGNYLDRTVSSADLVKESLRRICIWKVYGEADGIGTEWWDYVNNFETRCSTVFFNHMGKEDCIRECYAHSAVDEAKVDKCMDDSGGLVGDNPNTLLDLALEDQNEVLGSSKSDVVPGSRGDLRVFLHRAEVQSELSISVLFDTICRRYPVNSIPEICITCVNSLPYCFADSGRCAVAGGDCNYYVEFPSGGTSSSSSPPSETATIATTSTSIASSESSPESSPESSSHFLSGLFGGFCVAAVLAFLFVSYERQGGGGGGNGVSSRGPYETIELSQGAYAD